MDPISILEQWLEPITGPLKDFSTQMSDLADIHQNTLNSFNNLVDDLTDPTTTDPFTGPGADAMQTSANDFFSIEQPMSDLLTTTGPVEAITTSDGAVEGIMTAIFTAGAEVTDTGPLAAVTEVVDAAALVQGGVDVPNDVAAAGISLAEGAALVVILLQLAGTLLFIWLTWQNEMNSLISIMNPALPAKPKPISPSIPTASMESDLAKQYGVPLSVVEDIISKNPGLTKEQYALLIQYYKKYGGAIPYNVLGVFTSVDADGKRQIYYLTKGDMSHTRLHPDTLDSLSNTELLKLIQKLLNQEPDDEIVNKAKQFVDYNYYDVYVDGRYITVDIRISTSTRGRIISVFERD